MKNLFRMSLIVLVLLGAVISAPTSLLADGGPGQGCAPGVSCPPSGK